MYEFVEINTRELADIEIEADDVLTTDWTGIGGDLTDKIVKIVMSVYENDSSLVDTVSIVKTLMGRPDKPYYVHPPNVIWVSNQQSNTGLVPSQITGNETPYQLFEKFVTSRSQLKGIDQDMVLELGNSIISSVL